MKFTRSLPANAVARANVPMSTTTLKTLTLQACRICIRTVKKSLTGDEKTVILDGDSELAKLLTGANG